MTNNKEQIAKLTKQMLNESHEAMLKKVDKVLNSGCIDIESWDENNNPMILPKCILIAILKDEPAQYEARGTSFEKQIKDEVENIGYFI